MRDNNGRMYTYSEWAKRAKRAKQKAIFLLSPDRLTWTAFGIYHFIVRSFYKLFNRFHSLTHLTLSSMLARNPNSSSYANDSKWIWLPLLLLIFFLSISHLTSPFPFDIWSHTRKLPIECVFNFRSASVCVFSSSSSLHLSYYIFSLSLASFKHHQFTSDIINSLIKACFYFLWIRSIIKSWCAFVDCLCWFGRWNFNDSSAMPRQFEQIAYDLVKHIDKHV